MKNERLYQAGGSRSLDERKFIHRRPSLTGFACVSRSIQQNAKLRRDPPLRGFLCVSTDPTISEIKNPPDIPADFAASRSSIPAPARD